MSFKPIDILFRLGARGKPRSWSIVFRLALLFTVAAAGMLLFAMAGAYWVVVRHVDNDNDRYLTDKLAAIRADILADAGPQSLNYELTIIRAADKVYAVRVIDEAPRVGRRRRRYRRDRNRASRPRPPDRQGGLERRDPQEYGRTQEVAGSPARRRAARRVGVASSFSPGRAPRSRR